MEDTLGENMTYFCSLGGSRTSHKNYKTKAAMNPDVNLIFTDNIESTAFVVVVLTNLGKYCKKYSQS